MEKVYGICCGMGVHKKLAAACLRNGRKKEIRQTGATAGELPELAEWLKGNGRQMAAMESAGPYWKAAHDIMEMAACPLWQPTPRI